MLPLAPAPGTGSPSSRREVLQFAQELMPASTPQGLDPDAPDVLEVLRRALQLIFSADEATTVHLVYPNVRAGGVSRQTCC